MGTTTEGIQVAITADVGGYAAGLKGAAAATQDATKAMGGAAASAAKEHLGLVATLKEFKSEQTQNARVARFYASQLAEIIPGAQGARTALQALIGLGLEGFGIGLAIEAVVVGLSYIAEKVNEHNEQLKTLKKTAVEAWDSYADAMEAVRRSFEGAQTQAMTKWREETDKNTKQIRKLREEIEALNSGTGIWDRISGSGGFKLAAAVAEMLGFGSAVVVVDAALNKLTGHATEVETLAGQVTRLSKSTTSPEAMTLLDKTGGAEAVATKHATNEEIRKLEASTADEIVRINVDKTVRLNQLEKDRAKYGETYAALRTAVEQEAARKIADVRIAREIQFQTQLRALQSEGQSVEFKAKVALDNQLATIEETYRKRIAAGDKEAARQKAELQAQAVSNFDQFIAHQAAVREADRLKELSDYRQTALQKRLTLAQSLEQVKAYEYNVVQTLGGGIASSWASTLQEFVTGTKSMTESVGALFSGLATQILSLIAEMTTKWLVFNAIAGIASAFTGNPFAAIGLTKILGFADGGRYEAGKPMIVGEKGAELMVPDSAGTVVPNAALGGDTHYHFHGLVIDEASIRRMMASPEWQRASRETQRNGVGG